MKRNSFNLVSCQQILVKMIDCFHIAVERIGMQLLFSYIFKETINVFSCQFSGIFKFCFIIISQKTLYIMSFFPKTAQRQCR